MTEQLSPHFSLAEMTVSGTGARKGLDNTPPAEIVTVLKDTAQHMEKVRDFLGHPITVLSGFRSADVNRAVGGAKNSAHMTGHAVDFICPGFGPPLAVAKALAGAGIPFDQIIAEYGEWTHVSFAPSMREQTLTKMAGRPYEPGLHA